MTQKITLKAYTTDESHKLSAFVSFTSVEQKVIDTIDPKIPVEVTLDGLDAGNTIMFITHYGSDLVDALIKVYGTYKHTLDSVTLRVINGRTYHTTEELSDIYLEGLKVVL